MIFACIGVVGSGSADRGFHRFCRRIASKSVTDRTDENIDAVVGLFDGGVGVVHVTESEVPASHAKTDSETILEEEVGRQIPRSHFRLAEERGTDATFEIGMECVGKIEIVGKNRGEGDTEVVDTVSVPVVQRPLPVPRKITDGTLEPTRREISAYSEPVNIDVVFALSVVDRHGIDREVLFDDRRGRGRMQITSRLERKSRKNQHSNSANTHISTYTKKYINSINSSDCKVKRL